MREGDFNLRQAIAEDADSIASVFSPSIRLLTFLPELHTTEEDRWFIEYIILKETNVLVSEFRNRVVSFIAIQDEEIRLLHTHPEFIGLGAGSLLIDAAKQDSRSALELWCFQENHRGRNFYERHGFRPIRFTDGRRNEEKCPDVRYRWERTFG